MRKVKQNMYDIIIVGAGPAGLTAAVYARRAEKSVLIIEKESFGGQITKSPRVENYPGFTEISGSELADKLLEQIMVQGAEIELDEIVGIDGAVGHYILHGNNGDYETKTVIIATGAHHRTLGIYGEERLEGKGISYCAVCDGAFFRGQTVAVIGGGNSALVDALLLCESCERVYLVQNLPYLTGEERLQNMLMSKENVEIITSSVVDKLLGNESLRGIEISNTATGERRGLTVEGMFVCIGQEPSNDAFRDAVELNEGGYVIAGEDCTTKSDGGIFVAGDCRTKQIRQVTTATADGAVAALAACRLIDTL